MRSIGAFPATARLTCWEAMLGCAVKLIEERGAGRARALRERQQRGSPACRAGPVVAGGAGEHHAVNHQRVPALRKQLRQPHLGRVAVGPLRLEDVVLWHDSAGRQPTC